MKRNWTKTGAAYIKKDQREAIGKQLDKTTWHSLPHRLSMSGGMLIQEAIKELKLKRPTHVADYHDCPTRIAHYGVLGVRAIFSDCTVNIWLLDLGTETVVIATDPYYGQEAANLAMRETQAAMANLVPTMFPMATERPE